MRKKVILLIQRELALAAKQKGNASHHAPHLHSHPQSSTSTQLSNSEKFLAATEQIEINTDEVKIYILNWRFQHVGFEGNLLVFRKKKALVPNDYILQEKLQNCWTLFEKENASFIKMGIASKLMIMIWKLPVFRIVWLVFLVLFCILN